jgi:uncharacterized protein (DUF58 family)
MPGELLPTGPRQLLAQARRLRLHVRRAVAALPGGDFRSLFKGAGLAFEELRAYEPGDDVRAIDWNVTARLGHPYVKRFVEERELQLLILADVSGSLDAATAGMPLRRVLQQLVAFLGLAAQEHQARLGLALFTDRIEHYLRPARGRRHLMRLLQTLLRHQPHARGTSLLQACQFAWRVLRRRALLVLLSDWLSAWPEAWLRRLGRKHEVIAVRLQHPQTLHLPDVGRVTLRDLETGYVRTFDTRLSQPRPLGDWDALCRSARLDGVTLAPDPAALTEFVRFLQQRGPGAPAAR